MGMIKSSLIRGLLLSLVLTSGALAAVPEVIDYQGRLTDTGGDPINEAKLIKFIIYDAPASGTILYNSGFQTVTVADGLFNVQLGVAPMPALPDNLFSGGTNRYLGLTIGVDPEATPRTLLSSVPYAYQSLRSDSAGHAATSAYASDADLLDGLNSTDLTSASDFTAHTGDASAHHTRTTDAAELTTGTLAEERLPSTVPFLGANNVFSGSFNSFYSDVRVHDNDLNLWRDSKNRWSLREGATKGFRIQQRYNDADVLVNITRLEIDDAGLVQINGSSGTGQLNVATSEPYAGYFTSDLLSNSSHIVHAEYNGLAGTEHPIAVYGLSQPRDGFGYGGYFVGGNTGVIGEVTNSSHLGTVFGITGYSTHSATSGASMGVSGQTTNSGIGTAFGMYAYGKNDGTGIAYGIHSVAGGSSSGVNYGVYGVTVGNGISYAGYFAGAVTVTGTLSKAGGSFKIDHPLDPQNKYLQHSFVESPDMMNIYNNNVTLDANGEATVGLPDYFETLNRDFRYQLTAIGAPGPNLYIADEISGNRFRIAGGEPYSKVSWQVTGVRQDRWAEANRIQVEVDKPATETGLYIHPKAYGLSEKMFIHYELNQKAQADAERARR